MSAITFTENQIQSVTTFEELVSTPFHGHINALCWERNLTGDFSEIIQKVGMDDNMMELKQEDLLALNLSESGNLAREIILNDLKLLMEHGASPVLNIIKCYEKDDSFFPTDVYSFHVDRSPIPTDTFLCTYHGASSEIVPNSQAEQKILIPKLRSELKQLYDGADEGFDSFLSEYFFDLHYQAKPNAQIIQLGIGHIWKLSVDHPASEVLPCLHRAPIEKAGEHRLLLIC